MSRQLGFQRRPGVFDFTGVVYGFDPFLHRLAFTSEFLSAGLSANEEVSAATFTAVMCKAEKIKRACLAVPAFALAKHD